MPQWGRAGQPIASAAAGPRYGRRSILLAIAAFAIGGAGIAVFALSPSQADGAATDVATIIFMVALFGLAPLIQLVGFVYALVALFRTDERKGVALVGLLLNCVSVMMGGGFVYLMFANMGRFT